MYLREKTAQGIRDRLKEAAGKLYGGDITVPALELPKDKRHGDMASTVAFALAKRVGKGPKAVAEEILTCLVLDGLGVEKAEVAGPGFLNFTLLPGFWGEVLLEILELEEGYGRWPENGQRVLVEFVSANPTGPLNVVNARAAAVGDTLAGILEWAGLAVDREFYVNDTGRQVELLGLSLEARLKGTPIPEGGYPGEYLAEMAKTISDPNISAEELATWAVTENVEGQSQVLDRYGVKYDHWFRESSLHPLKVAQTVEDLREGGFTYEAEGAIWFASTRFGDDKDRVLVRQEGVPTYTAADFAYHREKFRRGYDLCIDLLGPDHHGYLARIRAGVQALGYSPGCLEVLIIQQVRLLRGKEAVTMSKRAGEFYTMAELLEEAGKDAARFFFLQRGSDSHLDFDLNLARLHENENPVYYVQYAHARIRSILRRWDRVVPANPDGALLAAPDERELLRHLSLFPGEIREAGVHREPHRLYHYALSLAGLFHSFYNQRRVLGEEEALEKARVGLVAATGFVLRSALRLMGVAAPQSM